MNYFRVYDQLMSRAGGRSISGYSESHHIIPRCLGGTDEAKNLVRLSAREHFIAHRLLTRMYPKNRGVWFALIAMGRIAQFKSRIFASERKQAAEMRKGFRFSQEIRLKMSMAKKGKPSVSPATCFKPGEPSWSAGRYGKEAPGYGTRRTPEQRQRMSKAQLACGNIPPSRKGVKWTEEQKAAARVKRQVTQAGDNP